MTDQWEIVSPKPPKTVEMWQEEVKIQYAMRQGAYNTAVAMYNALPWYRRICTDKPREYDY